MLEYFKIFRVFIPIHFFLSYFDLIEAGYHYNSVFTINDYYIPFIKFITHSFSFDSGSKTASIVFIQIKIEFLYIRKLKFKDLYILF